MDIQNRMPLPHMDRNFDFSSVKKDYNKNPEIERDLKDTWQVYGEERTTKEACPKVFGAVGTAIGAVLGRISLLPGMGAAVSSAVAGSFLGPLGTVVCGVVGFAAGAYAEIKTKAGRVAGGLAGAAVGTAAGKIAEKVGYEPSEFMAKETEGFAFKGLFKKLLDPAHTSHKLVSNEEAKKIIDTVQPGDLIVTNHDGDYKFELTQKALGQTGDWTHIGMVSKDKTMLEVLISADGFEENSLEDTITRNHHIMILRPNYRDRESMMKSEQAARDYNGVKYDHSFSLKTDDKHYCQEFVYKALQKGSPEINVEPSSLFGMKYVVADDFVKSPDTKAVYSTGSNFWVNFLSKFT